MVNLSYLDGLRNCILLEPSVNGTDIEFTLIDACSGKLISGLTESGVFRTKTDGTVYNAVSIVENSEGVYIATFGDDISSGDQIFVKSQDLWIESDVFTFIDPATIIMLTVGRNFGFFIGFVLSQGLGAVNPTGFEGSQIEALNVIEFNNTFAFSATPFNLGAIEFEFPNGTILNANIYDPNTGIEIPLGGDTTLLDYLITENGNTIPVTVTRP